MALTLFFSNEKKNWTLYWNRTLVFLFIATYFLGGITRYKHLIVILMTLTTLVYLCKQPRQFLPEFKNFLFFSIAVLTFAVFLSLFQTPDFKATLKEISKSVLENTLLCTISIPVLLRNESKELISKIIFFSFITALSLRCISEIVLYYQEYTQGVMPFIDFRHRGISDSLVFLFPALLSMWLIKSVKYKVAFVLLSAVYLFLILGTLSRGAWLSVLTVGLLWVVLNRQWKLLIAGILISTLTLGAILTQEKIPTTLMTKLQQTDSSNRYSNGVQGSAMNLIMENPLLGYGFGNTAYKDVYNKRVVDYPNWTFRESPGPHNLALFVWFGAGLLGFAGLLLTYAAIIKECTSNAFKKSSSFPVNAHMIILLSFIGYFLIRGNVEQIQLDLLGVLVGLLIALNKK
ncbi:O-antigen ligase RfaL [Enterobacter sp. Ap-916]|uniref:O-antigen ligase RfaL n=1 Tax=Enterobacteriaceae TaxID=543 RepID=UPI00141E5845|nr:MULTISPECIES: O-antigen ligase RfaL [unclassified Enterobacter]NIF60808.1 O-antigen ligase RfaL [Enterobacter sp. Ap-867]NIG31951.1 O-antigen ligase RfaL [Enterobacter sp. Ap-916]